MSYMKLVYYCVLVTDSAPVFASVNTRMILGTKVSLLCDRTCFHTHTRHNESKAGN